MEERYELVYIISPHIKIKIKIKIKEFTEYYFPAIYKISHCNHKQQSSELER